MDDQHDRVWASRRQPRPLRELEPAQLRLNSRPPCKLFTVAVNNLLGDIKTALRCLRERGCLSAEHAAEATELAGALAAMARPDVLVLSASEVAVCSLTALMNSDKMTPGLVTHPLDVGSLVAGEFALQTLSRARVVGKGATQARVVIGAARQRYTPRATRGALASGSLLSDAWCAAAGFGSVPRRSRFKSLGLRSALAKPPAAVVKAILDDLGLIDDASLPGLLQTHALVFRGVRSSESVMQARSDGVSVGGGSVIVGGACALSFVVLSSRDADQLTLLDQEGAPAVGGGAALMPRALVWTVPRLRTAFGGRDLAGLGFLVSNCDIALSPEDVVTLSRADRAAQDAGNVCFGAGKTPALG